MKRYKVLSLLLVLSMTICLFVGCGNHDNSKTSVGKSGNEYSGKKVKLSAIYIKHPLTKDFSEFKWLKEIEEEAGVQVKWQQISADWDQKKPTMLASGEIPDLLFTAVGDADFVTFSGLFENLAPLIDKYGKNIKKMFQEVPQTRMLAEYPDGKIWATPKYQRFWPKAASTMFINKNWLDNLNLKAPTDWDELYDVLVAFRDGDPNGNGDPKDEIPMDFNGKGQYGPMMLLGSTGIQRTNFDENGYYAENGEVKNYYIDERYKELMIYLNKLYQSNLINPEALTQDYSTFQATARGEGTTAKVGFTWGWESGDRFGMDLADQYISIPPLKQSADSNIDPRWMDDYYGLNMDGNRVSMSAKCKNKEVAMKFIDSFYKPENSLQVLFGGITDGCIEKETDGSYKILPPKDNSMDPGTWKWTNAFADGGPIFLPNNMKVTLGTDMQKVNEEKSVYDHALSLVDEKKELLPTMFFKMSSEDNNTVEMNRANFRNISDAKYAEFMTKGKIEEQWDQYVSDMKNAGVEQNNKIYQKYFDEYLKTLD